MTAHARLRRFGPRAATDHAPYGPETSPKPWNQRACRCGSERDQEEMAEVDRAKEREPITRSGLPKIGCHQPPVPEQRRLFPFIGSHSRNPTISDSDYFIKSILRRRAQGFSSLRALFWLVMVGYECDCFCERRAFEGNEGFMQECAGKAGLVGLRVEVCHFGENFAQSSSL
jgi:hypothetical protein